MSSILPLTKLEVGSVSEAVLVCGDPARASKIAQSLTDVVLLAENREYRTLRGVFEGTAVTVASHGVGASGAAIAFEELIAAGGKRLIRVGTCGGIQIGIDSGDLVIATAAVQSTGYGRETVPEGYPCVASPDLVLALRRAAKARQRPFREGFVLSRDNFYPGVPTPYTPNYTTLAAAQVLAVEMECSTLFLVGSLRGVQTGAILAVDGNVLHKAESMDTYDPHSQKVQEAVAAEIQIALQALIASF